MKVTNPNITIEISSTENPHVRDQSPTTIQSMLAVVTLTSANMKSMNMKQKRINPNKAAIIGKKIPLKGRAFPNKLVKQKAITADPGITHAYSALNIIVPILAF